jgi:hypothetical protein
MKTVHFYDLSTGLFTGASFSASALSAKDEVISRNTPPGCGAVEGVRDWRAQRVDLASGQLVDYQPPADVVERERRSRTARSRIEAIERGSLRALREALLGDPDALARLADADREISKQRKAL